MDSNLYDYASNFDAIFEKGSLLIESLVNFKSSHVSISWHPRTCSSDYNWHFSYEKYLDQVKKYESI